MLAFPGMLIDAAVSAGMAVPPEEQVDEMKFDVNLYPHFFVFCMIQLARPVAYHGEHWENAKVISSVPESDIRRVTLDNLIEKGLSYQF